jgi:hypothetical protein
VIVRNVAVLRRFEDRDDGVSDPAVLREALDRVRAERAARIAGPAGQSLSPPQT